ncbi:type I-E CRISPR-associated protein Cse2/CasB [Streptomyces globosus]|uniref:type I-E CRISPR-associated protein Cse2/CasB n=1 Tax=Streptomyces globosus TaxID=68209 RepID=UPI00381A526E
MTEEERSKQRIWHHYIGADGTWKRKDGTAAQRRPPGEDLAVLRKGLSRPAGTVLEMFPFYTCEVDDFAARRGEVSAAQEAEHIALALYGLHQQSQEQPMHRDGIGLGRAMRALRLHERTSEDAVDARFQQAFSATSTAALQLRLRGLVTQLRDIRQPLDYSRLAADILLWNRPDSRNRVRRRWGLDYHARPQKTPSAG